MTNPTRDSCVSTDICNTAKWEEDKLITSEDKLDENRNPWNGNLQDIYLGEVKVAENEVITEIPASQCEGCISKMTTVRGFLQSRKQYLPTALLLICVTIYLPYSYVSVLHAREEHLNEIRTSSGFQKVANRSHVVFSAYLDDRFPREPAKLRILGFKNKKDENPLYCKLYFEDETAVCLASPAIELRLDPKEEHHNLDTQCLFHCTLPDQLTKIPVGVTLTSSPTCKTHDHVVPVNPVQGDPKLKKDVAVCFSSPSSEFSGQHESQHLLEILELSRHFGASVVQMYNESMDSGLKRILKPYIKTSFLTLLPWNPGDRYLPSIAKALSINDCIYRNAAKFRSIIFVDHDEIILPSASYNSSWTMLGKKMRQVYPSAGAFWFEEVIYVSQEALAADTKPNALPKDCALNLMPKNQLPRIFTHRFLMRSLTKPKHKKYSQVLLDPSVVLYVDTDMRVSFLPGKSSTFLPTEVGQSVHFSDYKNVQGSDQMETLETFRSKYNVQLAAAIYNKLGYNKYLDQSKCTNG